MSGPHSHVDAPALELLRIGVAIVGGGVAGLRAAIAAIQADTAGVVRDDDSLAQRCDDTVPLGDRLCDQDAVSFFVSRCAEEMVQLEHRGCPWSRQEDRHISVRFFGRMSRAPSPA